MSTTKTPDLTAQVDGVTSAFTTPDVYIPGTLVVHVNGVRLTPDEFFETGTTTFTIGGVAAYPTLQAGEQLLVQYEVASTAVEGVVASGIDPATC